MFKRFMAVDEVDVRKFWRSFIERGQQEARARVRSLI